MHQVDAHIFENYIEKILQASSGELLWHGVLGHLSELSSAKEQRSEGAWAQAWSAAMYLEAMEEIVKPHEFTKGNFESGFGNEVLKPLVFKTEKVGKVSGQSRAVYEPSHKNLLKIYEILLVVLLIFSISIALGAAAFAAMF